MSYDGEFEISTIEAVIPEPDGSFLVVDHPGWHRGARVRRYSEKGAQTGRWLTPAGSTLFASDGARLAYIVSKQADESERLVLVDDTAEKTFVVPLNINSGGIVFIGSDVWIRTTSSVFDQASRKVTATEIVVPVVVDGKQVGDEAAKEAVREGWFAAGAELYERSRVVEGQGDAAVITQTLVRSSNGTRLEVPGRSVPLGVDADGAAFVLIEAETLDSRLSRLAAYPAAFGRTERVLVAGFDGAVRGMIVLPASPLSRQAPGRVALAPDGDLYAVRSGSDGASVVEYSVVPR